MVEAIKHAGEIDRVRCRTLTQQKFSIEVAVPRWRKALAQMRALSH